MELVFEELKTAADKIIKRERDMREAATQGGKYRLKRHPFNALDEKGLPTADNLLTEYALIERKQSTLSAGQRAVVQQLALMAIQEAAQQRKEQPKEKAKSE